MADLVIHVKDIYFQQVKSGSKLFEYRLQNEYWSKRLEGRHYDRIILMSGYPKATDTEKVLIMPYRGYKKQSITHPHFGANPVKVYGIHMRAK